MSQDARSTLTQARSRACWADIPLDGAGGLVESADRLWALLLVTYPQVQRQAARERLIPVLAAAVSLGRQVRPAGLKPTTWIARQIAALLALPEGEALACLQQPAPAVPLRGEDPRRPDGGSAAPVATLGDYIDLRLEAEDPTYRPDLLISLQRTEELGRRRYAYLVAHAAAMMPATAKGREATWGTIAELTIEALIGLTGAWPGRRVALDKSTGELGDEKVPWAAREGGWGLPFFQALIGLVEGAAPAGGDRPVEKTVMIWRDALHRLQTQNPRPRRRKRKGEAM